jgi:ABC-2 type transport system permease protein
LSGQEARRPTPLLPEGPPAPLALAADLSTFGTLGDLNLLGLWTLYAKEVRRFLKVFTQTVLAPVATTLMFLAIFALALGSAGRTIGGMPFLEFLAPGLLMMTVVQNAFANTSSSLMIAKIQGNIVDYLMPPLGPGELTFGLVMGGVTRGLLVAAAVWLAMLPFVPMLPAHPLLVPLSVLLASTLLSLVGLITALWAEKFDQMAAATNFVITPLSFLSGTFYSIADLPEPLHLLALVNPFFYMIDGLRFAFTGHADGPVATGFVVLVLVNAGLAWLAWHLVRTGYKLKA